MTMYSYKFKFLPFLYLQCFGKFRWSTYAVHTGPLDLMFKGPLFATLFLLHNSCIPTFSVPIPCIQNIPSSELKISHTNQISPRSMDLVPADWLDSHAPNHSINSSSAILVPLLFWGVKMANI